MATRNFQVSIQPTIRVELVKTDGQIFIFRFIQSQLQNAMRMVGHFAADGRLSFDWHDAAAVVDAMKEICAVNAVSYGNYSQSDASVFAVKEF